MNIKDDYVKFIDKWGLVQPPPKGKTSANGARYTAEYIAVLKLHNQLSEEEKSRLRAVYRNLEAEPGLLMRTPDNKWGQESIDNTLSCIYVDHVINTGFCRRWLKYGRVHSAESFNTNETKKYAKLIYNILSCFGFFSVKFVFNNKTPYTFTFSSWFGRFPYLIALTKLVSGEKIGFVRKTLIALALYMGSKDMVKHEDPAILGWFTIQIARKESWLIDWVVRKFWIPSVKKKWPEAGIGGAVWPLYDHPTSMYLNGIFE